MTRRLSLTVNGRPIEAVVEPRMHLADFIRDALRLTGTHLGCEHGVCGACTVLIDGAPMRSCIAYAIACEGADIRTIEGFENDPLMQALRHAFARHHALQCGYCTPGMLITAHDVVRRLPGADEARVREELSGNLCRCTGYVGIVEAVEHVLANPPASGDGFAQSTARPSADPRTDSRTTAPRPDIPAPRPGSDSHGATQGTTNAASARAAPGADPSLGTPTRHASDTSATDESRHEIALATAPDSLWTVLKDIAAVVPCLPGASLAGPPDADPLSLVVTVAIGPIRARFEGNARVDFDDCRHTATIEGSGQDTRSRSTAQGRIELSVRPATAGGSVLLVRMHYALRGPLAQFSRGAVVDAVVEQLLEQFAANVVSMASGEQTVSSPRIGALRLAAAALRRWLRRWFKRSLR